MLHNPALYRRSNGFQRGAVKQLLEEYSNLQRWRSDGKDSLIDIGCGSGDVTVDYVLPLLPLNFSRLVGADISDEMLQYAREHVHHSKIEFHKLDIGVPLDRLVFDVPFDHITSFYCLNWVNDQEMALKNFYNLLSTDGDCLFGTLAGNPWYYFYKPMSLTSKWAPYLADLEAYNFPYNHIETAEEDLKKNLKNAGFKDIHVTVHDLQYVFDGKEELKNVIGTVTKFLSRMSSELQDEFIDLLASTMQCVDGNDSKFMTTYPFLNAFARK